MDKQLSKKWTSGCPKYGQAVVQKIDKRLSKIWTSRMFKIWTSRMFKNLFRPNNLDRNQDVQPFSVSSCPKT
ncbi:MAG: hypothetical protein ABI851_13090 [Saprospiraceae bacterium]